MISDGVEARSKDRSLSGHGGLQTFAFPSSEEGASILMNNSDKDRVLFKNISGSGQTCGGGTLNATEVAEINAYCKDLIDILVQMDKGLFVVRHDRQSAGDKFYIYPFVSQDTEATSKW